MRSRADLDPVHPVKRLAVESGHLEREDECFLFFCGDDFAGVGVLGGRVEVSAEGLGAPVVVFLGHEGLGFAGAAEVAAGEVDGVGEGEGEEGEGEEGEEGDG